MNKSDLIAAVAAASGQDARSTQAVLDAFEQTVVTSVAAGQKVTIPGFLTFESAERAARTGRNPSTGAEIQIAAATVPKVKVGKSFKDAVGK